MGIETKWAAKLKKFDTWSFTEKACRSLPVTTVEYRDRHERAECEGRPAVRRELSTTHWHLSRGFASDGTTTARAFAICLCRG